MPDDVYRFKGVESVSCFKFESFLYFIKRLVRSGRAPLKQAINRYLQGFLPFISLLVTHSLDLCNNLFFRWLEYLSVRGTLQQFHDDITDSQERKPTMVPSHSFISCEYPEYIKYKRLTTSKYVFNCNRKGDSCCLLKDNCVLEGSFFARSKTTGQLFIAGRKYVQCKPLYDDMECCSLAGIYQISKLASDVNLYPIDENDEDMLKKMYRLPLYGTKDFVCSNVLHGI